MISRVYLKAEITNLGYSGFQGSSLRTGFRIVQYKTESRAALNLSIGEQNTLQKQLQLHFQRHKDHSSPFFDSVQGIEGGVRYEHYLSRTNSRVPSCIHLFTEYLGHAKYSVNTTRNTRMKQTGFCLRGSSRYSNLLEQSKI